MTFFLVDRIDEKGAWDLCYEKKEDDRVSWVPFARVQNIQKYNKQSRENFIDALMDAFCSLTVNPRVQGKVYSFEISDYFDLESEQLLKRLKAGLEDKGRLVDF